MKKAIYPAIILLVIVAAFYAGIWYTSRVQEGPTVEKAASLPAKTAEGSREAASVSEDPSRQAGTVSVSPEQQQRIGVKTGVVQRVAVTHSLRLPGRVAVDENRVFRVIAAADGWIRNIYPKVTGTLVRKDEPLATFYAPEFLGPQQAYIYQLNALDRFQASGKESADQITLSKANVQSAKDSLMALGMGERQVEEIGRTRQLTQDIIIASPVTGFVLARNVTPGQRFERGSELYQIADLSHVWILADLFESDYRHLKPGVTAKISLPVMNQTLNARVSDTPPIFDAATRTMKVRIETKNPGLLIRPGMFVDVEIPVTIPQTIAVPADAVLDSGLKKTVFVDRGNGFFEPREVETGWHFGNKVQILKGLEPGERIVISGNFLIDSESRMELAAAGMYGTLARDPVCGASVPMKKAVKAGLKSVYRGKTYYFSSDECKKQFEQNPDRYLE